MGMADVVVLNDPITGQGSNTASKAAKVYMTRILERGDKPFDAAWMQDTFNSFWTYAQWVVKWTNSLLTPPPPHILQLMGAASQIPPLASRSRMDLIILRTIIRGGLMRTKPRKPSSRRPRRAPEQVRE